MRANNIANSLISAQIAFPFVFSPLTFFLTRARGNGPCRQQSTQHAVRTTPQKNLHLLDTAIQFAVQHMSTSDKTQKSSQVTPTKASSGAELIDLDAQTTTTQSPHYAKKTQEEPTLLRRLGIATHVITEPTPQKEPDAPHTVVMPAPIPQTPTSAAKTPTTPTPSAAKSAEQPAANATPTTSNSGQADPSVSSVGGSLLKKYVTFVV
jgi:hypothetical protein